MSVATFAGYPTGFVVDALSRMGKTGWIADLLPRSRTTNFTGRARTIRLRLLIEVAQPVTLSMHAVMRRSSHGKFGSWQRARPTAGSWART